MKSMTGHGRGHHSAQGGKITVEVSSVNRRQSEISLSVPPELESLEPRIRDEINRRFARGRLTVRIHLELGQAQWTRRARVNLPLAQAYAHELNRLRRALKLDAPLTLDTLLRLPGILQNADDLETPEAYWPATSAALHQSLERLTRMREREGAHLARDLKQRIATMRKLIRHITGQAPEVTRRYRDQLRERLAQADLPNLPAHDDRLLKEIALFADRSDISEELTRFQSHFQQFDDCLQSTEPVGRTLDFLAQEMNREANTIGSKANDGVISRAVVELKAELERFREQVQNVE